MSEAPHVNEVAKIEVWINEDEWVNDPFAKFRISRKFAECLLPALKPVRGLEAAGRSQLRFQLVLILPEKVEGIASAPIRWQSP